MHLRIVVVMGLLYKLVFNEFVDNFCSTELDVSLLTKMTKTLSWVLIVLNDASIADGVKDVLGNAIFEVHKLFDEIKTESLRCKVDALFRRVINYKLQTLIETLEGLSLGELASELGVFNTDWNQTPDSFYPLSTYLSALLDKIVSSDFIGKFQATKLDLSLLEKLQTILERVLHTDYVKVMPLDLHDAVDKHTFRLWLCMLKDAIFELLNLFDEINREALHFKVEAAYETPTPPSLGLNTLYSAINSKLKNLIARLEFCSLRVHGQFGGSSFKTVWHETPSNSILDDESSSIYGRDNDIKELKHLLLSEDSDDSKIGIISIVGMEGIGKTALAKLLYNDTKVRDKFELQVWAHVSKDFDDLNVFETILNDRNNTSEVNNIYPKCLIVLDEVCDARSIRTLLANMSNLGETGSRIIITTQDERVALSIQTFGLSMQTFLSVHYLRPLESEDCWTLLAGHAFGACNDQQRSNLEEIGRGIANKCYGSPFAAVALGDILCTKLSLDYWNYVLENDILLLLDHDVRPFIQLSYHYLPTPLKRCFEYCSIFPKKSMIEKNLIVQLWIAEGLVEWSTDQEKVGEEYFDVLVSRSLLHRRSIGNGEVNIEMHNLVHDLATKVSSPNCINMDEHNLHDRVRNLSYNRGIYDSYSKFDKLYGLKDQHTFLSLPLQKQLPLSLLSNKVVHDLLPTMKQLRVLSLSNYKSITDVPKSIGNLLYLRYLNLSHTMIIRLPSETCKLYGLQFLLLSGCNRLTELPKDMGKLVSLRHLDVSDTALREMPVQMAELENLQTLSDFVVSKHNDGLKLADLRKFIHLHGKLSISQLQNVDDPFEADQANMKMKKQIKELALEWDRGSSFPDSPIQSVVLEHLQPSTNLKSLTIKGYGGICFPNWLSDSLYRNMVYLRISNSDNCLWLPPLGQLGNLKELIIEGMQSVETIGIEFYGTDNSSSFQPFLSLEILHFEDMQELEEWNFIDCTATATKFPSLKTLSLSKCPKLRVENILGQLPSLAELELRECPLLVQSIPSSNHVFRHLMFPFNSLQQLIIDGFPSPMSFPADGLPKTLKFLIISNCEYLEFLPHEYLDNFTSLEELKISYSCNSMISFNLGALPVLKSLFIEGCRNLKSISIAEDASKKSLSFLRSIKIWDCNALESFPAGGMATSNLVYIALWKCEKLHSLPEAMNSLTVLKEMEIDNLPNLQSFVVDDLPSSLQELTVGSVGGIVWNTEQTWEHLTCLSVLRINGNDTVNSLMVPLLPASLLTLCVCGFTNTSFDGRWIQHLNSLQNLEIVNAPKLMSLPKKGFPSSLSVLSLTRCPLLEASLRRKRGREWRKIAHIPAIIIDDELMT